MFILRVIVPLVLLGVPSSSSLAGSPAKAKPCVTFQKRARPVGGGYRHVVDLHNRCDAAQTCHVKSSSNPQGVTRRVAAKSTASVVMHIRSPASAFTVQLTCRP